MDTAGKKCLLTDGYQSSIRDVASCMIYHNRWENLELYENLHRSGAGSERLQQVKNKLGKYHFKDFVFIFRFSNSSRCWKG